MALPIITKIFYRSDFTIQLPLAEGYDGQEFRFTLYTCGEPENGWVASYIDGVYTNCTVEDDIVVIYVNNNNKMNPGCLTVQSEYDYFNSHFRDNEDNVKDTYKTNVYLVSYRTNSFSAEFRPTNLPDLTNVSDYVTFTDLEAMSYATTSYVADYVATYGGNVDLSAYVTKTELAEDLTAYVTKEELNEAGYLTSVPSNYATKGYVAKKESEVKADTYSYVVDYVSTYAPTVDLSAYAKKSDLNAYVSKTQLQQDLVAYVSKEELNAAGYVTSSVLDGYVTDTELYIALDDYATKSYVVDYVATYGGNVDMSAYVTKDELNQAGYLTSIPSEYVTDSELNSTLSSYITESELNNMSYADKAYVSEYVATYGGNVDLSAYATKSYVADYVATYGGNVDLSSYVTKDELNQAGYITSIPSEYITESELGTTLSSYVTKSQLNNAGYITSIPSEYITESELGTTLSSYAKKSDLNSYATKTYVAEYVSNHSGSVDLSAYVTKDELNAASYITQTFLSNAGYITSIPSEYITETELSAIGYSKVVEISAEDYELLSYAEKTNGYIYVLTDSYYEYDPTYFVSKTELNNASYATQTYVADYVAQHAPTPDLSSYVTKTELNNASYITQSVLDAAAYITAAYVESKGYAKSYILTQSQYDALISGGTYDPNTIYIISDAAPVDLTYYVLKTELGNAGYATQSYVVEYVATYAPTTDLSSYVTKTELNNASYITQSVLDAAAYITAAYVESKGYAKSYILTQSQYDALISGGTYDPNTIYIISDAAPVDLTYYVLKTELGGMSYITMGDVSACGYITSIPSDYATYDAISSMGYITSSDLSSYVTKTELNNASYLQTTGGELTGQLYVSYNAPNNASYSINTYSHIVAGNKDKTTVTLIGTKRKCGDESYMSCFFTNSDGRSKFSHKTQGNNSSGDPGGASDDAFLCFDAYGFKLAYSGTVGTVATTEYDIVHTGNISSFGFISYVSFDASTYTLTISI